MDPQERLFLREPAGRRWRMPATRARRCGSQHGGRVGVFAGITKTGFALYGPALWRAGGAGSRRSTSFGSVANRVSYLLNLHGPSMPIDTMCSSSLTAIHLACEHLHAGECEVAMAGGVNLYLHPRTYVPELCGRGCCRSDGRCRSFGEGGDGYVPGEGVGAVLLEAAGAARKRTAITIYAVIRGTQHQPRRQDQRLHGARTRRRRRAGRRRRCEKAGVDARGRSATSRRTAPARSWAIRSRSRG